MSCSRPFTLPLAIAGLLVAALGCAPLSAHAAGQRPLEPPTLGAPGRGPMKDAVLDGGRGVPPRASAAAGAGVYRTADGYSIPVTVSAGYNATDSAVQVFVDFIAGLPHGSELGRLRLEIATPSEVGSLCGGAEGTLACYVPAADRLIVPGERPPGTDLALGYIIAHEYGHHLANHRSNSPFDAEDFGPKYWASDELVCRGVIERRYFPGDEGDNYQANPGEAWAETYAQLTYPGVRWDFAASLAPDAGSLAAARRDVTTPWTSRRTVRFSGTLGSKTRKRDFRLNLTLDGSVSVSLSGPKRSNYDLTVRAQGDRRTTTRSGSRDRLTMRSACRSRASEKLTVRVQRKSGSGPFALTVKYAG